MERRQYKRYPIKVLKTLKYELDSETISLEGFIENISLGGCNFITTNTIPNEIQEVFFEVRSDKKNVPLLLEVVRRGKSEFFKKECNEYGLKFKKSLDAAAIKNMKFI